MQNEKRTEIQQKALELHKKHDHILLTWATGCGKSLAALQCISKGSDWIIVCKEINHIENWKRDIEKHGLSHLLTDGILDIICYASLHKWNEYDNVNLILDEVHAVSELREERIRALMPNKIISLSATVDDEIRGRLRSIRPFVEYSITTSEAIDAGILPEPKVYVVYTDLEDSEKLYTAKIGKKAVKLTAKGYYAHLSRNIEYWRERWERTGEQWVYKKYMVGALDRKRWIADYKTKLAAEILEKIKDRRFICFTGSIEQCNELGGDRVIHSKITSKNREKLVNDLNSKVIDSLFCVNMMKEGMNIEEIEAGMIVQLDGANDRSFIQTLGRTLRGEKPEFYILVVRKTQDERYLETALANFDKKYLTTWKE